MSQICVRLCLWPLRSALRRCRCRWAHAVQPQGQEKQVPYIAGLHNTKYKKIQIQNIIRKIQNTRPSGHRTHKIQYKIQRDPYLVDVESTRTVRARKNQNHLDLCKNHMETPTIGTTSSQQSAGTRTTMPPASTSMASRTTPHTAIHGQDQGADASQALPARGRGDVTMPWRRSHV